jgi:hypothetical protein
MVISQYSKDEKWSGMFSRIWRKKRSGFSGGAQFGTLWRDCVVFICCGIGSRFTRREISFCGKHP